MADSWRNVTPVEMPKEETGSWRDVTPVEMSSWRDVAPTEQPTTVDVFTQLRQNMRFRDLLSVQRMLQVAIVDPSVGDPNVLRNRVDELRDLLLDETGLTRSTFDEFVRQELGVIGPANDIEQAPYLMYQAARATQAGVKLGTNTLGAAYGAVADPLSFLADTTRTFVDNLADVQAERVGVAPEEVAQFEGAPAQDPLTAIMDMSKAAWLTGQDMNLTDEPLFTRDEEGKLGWNPENGWVVYAPDLVWNGNRRGVSSHEANLAPRGRDLVDRFKIAERVGVEGELGKELLGLGAEMLLDPLLAADAWFTFGKAARAVGAVFNNDVATNAGRALERLGAQMADALSPAGMARTAGDIVRAEPTGAGATVLNAITQGVTDAVNGVLDIPVPFARGMLSDERRAAAGVLGWEEGKMPPPLVRDLFFQRGRVENLSGGPLEILAGSERLGVSAGELAVGTQRVVQSIAARGVQEIGEALTSGLTVQRGFRAPWMRVSVPTANQLTEEGANFYRSMSTIVSDFVSSRGVLPKNQVPAEFSKRLRAVADLYGHSYEDVVSRFRTAAGAARRVAIEVGHEVSGYRYFTQAMDNVAERMGMTGPELRLAFEQFVGKTDVQKLELQDFFTLAPAGTTGAVEATSGMRKAARNIVDGWIADPPSFARLEQAIQDELGVLGRNDLRGITPSSYLVGIRNGYLPRMFNLVEDPVAAINALDKRDIITLRSVEPSSIANEMASAFGRDVAGDVRRFFTARAGAGPDAPPAITFRADDLANIISKRAGRTVTPEEVAEIVYANDDNYQFLNETIEMLKRPAGTAPRTAGTGGAPWAMTPSAFASRQEFDAQDLARRVQIQDPMRQVAEIGIRGGRQVRAQTFLAEVTDGLREMGLVRKASEVSAKVPEEGSEYIFPFINDADGLPMVVLPNRPQVWGPLANQAIPADVAKMITYSTSFGRLNRTARDALLSNWRSMLLSPASTSIRNLVSTFLLMQRAGGDLTDMVTTLPEASKLRRFYLETGRLPDEFRGLEQYMGTFTSDASKVSTALKDMDVVLDELARGGDRATNALNNLLDNAEKFIQWSVENPAMAVPSLGGTGFLGMFRWGEETTRLTGFMTTFRRLISDGVPREEAARRAAHFASNAAHNYGASPIIPDWLRRTGLSAFPQFSWFTLSRTFRAATERPATISRVEYARQAANIAAFEGDMDEQERVTAMSADWLRYSKPLAIPIPGQDGRYYVFNAQYWLPDGDFLSTILEPSEGGALQGLVDGIIAWTSGTGVGFFGAKYGQRYFDPEAGTGQRIAQTAAELASQYVFPGVFRQYERGGQAIEYNQNKELFDLWGLETGKFFNSDWAQVFASSVGLTSQKVSVRMHEPSAQNRIRDINEKYKVKIDSLNRKLKEVAFFSEEHEALSQEILQLRIDQAYELQKLARLTR